MKGRGRGGAASNSWGSPLEERPLRMDISSPIESKWMLLADNILLLEYNHINMNYAI